MQPSGKAVSIFPSSHSISRTYQIKFILEVAVLSSVVGKWHTVVT